VPEIRKSQAPDSPLSKVVPRDRNGISLKDRGIVTAYATVTSNVLPGQLIRQLVAAVVFPVIGYRPKRIPAQTWDREYREGKWRFLREVENIGGTASILGYCEHLNPQAILDVGCGEGLLAKKLKLLPYSSYLGLDVSREAIAQAQHLADHRTRFVVAEADAFQWDGTFDVIVFNQILYYLPDPAATTVRYRGMLAPEGRIIVSIFDSPRTREAWRTVKRAHKVEDEMTITQGTSRTMTAVLTRDAPIWQRQSRGWSLNSPMPAGNSTRFVRS
jgi:2-polyprenyl-3-methyl-5-hydroxy-6-metoxy-1,4-benzoquinol methylase